MKLKPGKRVPQSTPSSPSKTGREPRCTCAMTIEQMQRARDGRARYAASVASTLPRSQTRPGDDRSMMSYGKLSAHPSSQSVYDNVSTSLRKSTPIPNAVKQTRSDVNLTTIGKWICFIFISERKSFLGGIATLTHLQFQIFIFSYL